MDDNESDVWSDLSKRFSKNLIDPAKPLNLLDNRHNCCQLVAAINATTILTGQTTLTEDETEEFVDLVKCRNGGALNMKAAYPKLGLKVTEYEGGIPPFAWFYDNLPTSFVCHDPQYGFHCVLITGTYYTPGLYMNADYGFYVIGTNVSRMPWELFCQRLPLHEHQLCFRKYEIDE